MTTTICIVSFLSTLSLRRATDVPVMSLTEYGLFLSTLSLRRATTEAQSEAVTTLISIHALLAESDSAFDVLAVSAVMISIHALLAESDYDRPPLLT